ncbi:MAG: hypothetical protein F6K65_25600 [Moorea sp. SIO3C2]|nr:hypothetical protein [Moorena sp. SIO3C2]
MAARRLQQAGGELVQGVLDMRTVNGTRGLLKDFTEIEKKIEQIQIKRRGLIAIDPNDTIGIKELRVQEAQLQRQKEKLGEPIIQLQTSLSAQIKLYTDALAEYDRKANLGEITQENYLRITEELRGSLLQAEKAQKFLNSQIRNSVSSLANLHRRFSLLNAELADQGTLLEQRNRRELAAIAQLESRGFLTPGQANTARQVKEQELLRDRIQENQRAVIELRESLAIAGSNDILKAWQIDIDTTGIEQFANLAARAEERGNVLEKEVFTQYQRIKEIELETSGLEVELLNRQAEAQQSIVTLNKQIADYYKSIERQAEEIELEATRAIAQIEFQTEANKLKTALLGVGDNIISQFVESMIDAAKKTADISTTALDAQQKLLANRFRLQDSISATGELQRQLPGEFSGNQRTAQKQRQKQHRPAIRTGPFRIVESVGGRIQNVETFEDLEKHHPSSGREPGRTYRVINGELEEIRKLANNVVLIKKDFVLTQKGNQAVQIPAFATGFVKRLNDKTNAVRIYEDREMTRLLGQSLHMVNVPVQTGDFVRYGQTIGTQGGAGGYPVHAHIELEKERFERYIQDLRDGIFEEYENQSSSNAPPVPEATIRSQVRRTSSIPAGAQQYAQYLNNPNVRAALDTIPRAEGANYNTIFGGGTISSLAKHPNRRIRANGLTSSAAGRYQFLDFTWFGRNGRPGLKQQLGLTDFSPQSQDLAAIALLDRRGILDEIVSAFRQKEPHISMRSMSV